jgi:hypothetical protein
MGDGEPPSVRAAFSHAINRVFQILFKTFSAGVWTRLFLFIMMARMNPVKELAARILQVAGGADAPALEPGPNMARMLAQRLAGKWDAFTAAPFSGQFSDAAVMLLVLVLTLVVALHVSGWGVFLLLHGWHNPRARFGEAFNNVRGLARPFIRWKFAYTLPLLALFLAGAFVFFKEAVLPFARGAEVDVAVARVWGSLLAWGGALALLSTVNFLTDQFAAPLMWLVGGSVRGAFALVWQCAKRYPWAFARVTLAYGMFFGLVTLFTALVFAGGRTGSAGVLWLALLFTGYVPFHVLMRGFALCYLAQWRPELARGENAKQN